MNTDRIREEAEREYPILKDCPTPCILTSEELAGHLRYAYAKGATRSAWVSVDSPPEIGLEALLLSGDEIMVFGKRIQYNRYGYPEFKYINLWNGDTIYGVTMWQPKPSLPDPPQK